jgi:hypothetical protein
MPENEAAAPTRFVWGIARGACWVSPVPDSASGGDAGEAARLGAVDAPPPPAVGAAVGDFGIDD